MLAVVVASITSFSLISSMLMFVAVEAVAAPALAAGSVLDLPSIGSSAAPDRASSTPAGDFSSVGDSGAHELAPAGPEGAGANEAALNEWLATATEADVVRRSEYATTYRTPDGSFVDVTTPYPSNVRDVDDRWVPGQTRLEAAASGWRTDKHPLNPRFADRADSSRAVVLTREGHEVTFSLTGAGPGTASTQSSNGKVRDSLIFRGIAPQVDLEHVVEQSSVKETVILATPNAGTSSLLRVLTPGRLGRGAVL
ncbi:hypothetical protein [Yonghaparkia sp. Root332]|uniref:hypothetical protein n=1 Tax=Yonghaparkia sp. Root332 TaxID=1736516 RepID=UPI0012E3C6AA|nr:hypothetical protein [Yonghaparkia sp. Root332]